MASSRVRAASPAVPMPVSTAASPAGTIATPCWRTAPAPHAHRRRSRPPGRPDAGPRRRCGGRDRSRGARATGRAPTPWRPTGRVSRWASSPPTAPRSCSPTPRPAWSAPPMPAGAARSPASSRRPSPRWSRSAPTPARSPPAIGPCIAQRSYEVGADLRDAVLAQRSRRTIASSRRAAGGRWQFDLSGYCAARLAAAGDRHGRRASTADTAADEARFFSHRRRTLAGGGPIGHQISIIALDAGLRS